MAASAVTTPSIRARERGRGAAILGIGRDFAYVSRQASRWRSAALLTPRSLALNLGGFGATIRRDRLPDVANGCINRLSKPILLLTVAHGYCVLRPGWCQKWCQTVSLTTALVYLVVPSTSSGAATLFGIKPTHSRVPRLTTRKDSTPPCHGRSTHDGVQRTRLTATVTSHLEDALSRVPVRWSLRSSQRAGKDQPPASPSIAVLSIGHNRARLGLSVFPHLHAPTQDVGLRHAACGTRRSHHRDSGGRFMRVPASELPRKGLLRTT